EPVYHGMPPTERGFEVGHYGRIRCGGACKDDYRRIVLYHDGGLLIAKLQDAAMASYKDAVKALGRPIHLTGIGWRSCEDQKRLHAQDPSRFAPADQSAHCRGLAIDLSTVSPFFKKARKLLEDRRWYLARPSEPWHLSFGIEA